MCKLKLQTGMVTIDMSINLLFFSQWWKEPTVKGTEEALSSLRTQ